MKLHRTTLTGTTLALLLFAPAIAQEAATPGADQGAAGEQTDPAQASEPAEAGEQPDEALPGNNLAPMPDESGQDAAYRANAQKWDIDGNGTITGEEFMNEWEERNIYREWDYNDDGNVTSEELARRFIEYYDADGSNAIEEYEQGEFGRHLGTQGFFGQ